MFHSIEQDLLRLKYRQPREKNLSKEGYKSITSLRNNPDIIIKPADKGSGIVILDKQYYINEGDSFIIINFMKRLNLTSLGRSYKEGTYM